MRAIRILLFSIGYILDMLPVYLGVDTDRVSGSPDLHVSRLPPGLEVNRLGMRRPLRSISSGLKVAWKITRLSLG